MSKKGTKAAPKEVSSYDTRDVVLGKVRGYPPWPGMVVDPDSVPAAVRKERPGSKKATFYCVQFFPTGDYAWLVPKDISKLQQHEIESYINEPYKKSGDLLSGYRIALDPKEWEQKRVLATDDAVEEEANAEIDQLESEDEHGVPKRPPQSKSKKRKRESDAASSAPKAKKAPKPKKDSSEPTVRKKAGSGTAAKGRKNGNKSKTMVESEDEAEAEAEDAAEAEDDDAGPSKKASPPPAKKTKREKDDDNDDVITEDPEAIRVREWRHKLQKAFLGKVIPKEEDTPALADLFTTVETYDKISVQYLQFSKIGKVMRHIALLPDERVPRDAEFKFRERARKLVDRWHAVLNANKEGGNGGSGEGEGNGNGHKEEQGVEEKTKDEVVTKAAAELDLNGNGGDVSMGPPPTSGDTDADAEVETEPQAGEDVVQGQEAGAGDVTMSEE